MLTSPQMIFFRLYLACMLLKAVFGVSVFKFLERHLLKSILLFLIFVLVSCSSDYNLSMDLHIGVTNSRGQVFEFDKDGLSSGRDWSDSLLVHQLDTQEEEVQEIWDSVLQQVSTLDSWSASR